MRKLLSFILVACPMVAMAAAGPITVANEQGLPYSNQYPVNLNAPKTAANKLSAQVSYSSFSVVAQTFTDGRQSTGSITVASNNILAKQAVNSITVPTTNAILGSPATAQITVTSVSGIAGACINLVSNGPNGTYVFCNGAPGGWTGVSTTSGTAASIAASMNGVGGILASWAGGTSSVIFTTAAAVGFIGNTFVVSASTPGAISTTTFSGGKDRALLDAYFQINGVTFKNGYHWSDQSNTSTGTAISINALLNARQVLTSTTDGVSSVIFATVTAPGAAGNNFTLVSSTPTLKFATPNFTGGQDSGKVCINGTCFTAGIDFSTGTTAQTATNLATAINASSTTSGVKALAISSVVNTTSTVIGVATNYAVTSSSDSALTLSQPKTVTNNVSAGVMTGGLDPAYRLNSPVIAMPNNKFTTALPVLYTGTPAIGGLVANTTYFVIVVDASDISLSTSSQAAINGSAIVITSSSSQTTSDTYTLAPLSFTQGPAGAKWQVSNDGTTWNDYLLTAGNIVVSSQTFTPVFPSSSVIQDFGVIDYGFIRYNVTAPTQGAITLKVILNAKD